MCKCWTSRKQPDGRFSARENSKSGIAARNMLKASGCRRGVGVRPLIYEVVREDDENQGSTCIRRLLRWAAKRRWRHSNAEAFECLQHIDV